MLTALTTANGGFVRQGCGMRGAATFVATALVGSHSDQSKDTMDLYTSREQRKVCTHCHLYVETGSGSWKVSQELGTELGVSGRTKRRCPCALHASRSMH